MVKATVWSFTFPERSKSSSSSFAHVHQIMFVYAQVIYLSCHSNNCSFLLSIIYLPTSFGDLWDSCSVIRTHPLTGAVLYLVLQIVKQSLLQSVCFSGFIPTRLKRNLLTPIDLLSVTGCGWQARAKTNKSISCGPRASDLACSYLLNYSYWKFETSAIRFQLSRALKRAVERSEQP